MTLERICGNLVCVCECCFKTFDPHKEHIVYRFDKDFCSIQCSEKWFDHKQYWSELQK